MVTIGTSGILAPGRWLWARALLWLVVLTVASVWGILEVYTDVPHLSVLAMLPIWCAGLMVGQFWNWKAGR